MTVPLIELSPITENFPLASAIFVSNGNSFLTPFEPYFIKKIAKEPNLFYALKQPSKCVLKKRYSENIDQTYRRKPMPKYDFNKIALCCKVTSFKPHFGMGVLL